MVQNSDSRVQSPPDPQKAVQPCEENSICLLVFSASSADSKVFLVVLSGPSRINRPSRTVTGTRYFKLLPQYYNRI